MNQAFGIHWFRRDLRVTGNPALEQNRARHKGRVLGLACIDSGILSRADLSIDRFQFYLETLRALRDELRASGGDLLVLGEPPEKSFERLITSLRAKRLPVPALISWNRDYEPFSIERDARVERALGLLGVETLIARDHLLIEPHEITKDDRKSPFYQVFTPFRNKWLKQLKTGEVKARLAQQSATVRKPGKPLFELTWEGLLEKKLALTDCLEEQLEKNGKRSRLVLPRAGSLAAFERAREFGRRQLETYANDRDYPALAGTSRLSVYLKNGSVTTAQLISWLELEPGSKFLDELIWREFYYYILAHFPRVETGAFREKLNALEWENDEQKFKAWTEGRTGYPIVDAGMRELAETGWMHNRVRMIVASFLTKDLLISWQWGERFFMQHLLDGDLASNNGGWQWAASTGCDPQPYFRIFNPVSQGKKFDPKGEYVRRYLPELKKVSDREVHKPRDPIVSHDAQRLRALRLFRQI